MAPTLLPALVLLACDSRCRAGVDWFAADVAPAAGAWAQYRLAATHTGQAPGGSRVGPELALTWKSAAYAIGDYSASKGSPTLVDDTVYVGFDDGILRALDAADGSLRWDFATRAAQAEVDRSDSANRGIHGTPAVAKGIVYIGAYDGWLYALDADDGSLVWEAQLGDSIGASPVLYQGGVFMAVELGDPEGKVDVLDAATGCTCYETPPLGDNPHSSVSIDPVRGRFFVGSNNGRVSAFDLDPFVPAWVAAMEAGGDGSQDGAVKSTVAVDGDTVYATSWDHSLHALDAETGQRRFDFQTGGKTMSSPSLWQGVAYLGSHDHVLYAVDADPDASYADDQARERWRFATGNWILSSPTVVPEAGVLLVGSNDDSLYMLDLADGHEVWSAGLDGHVSSVPTVVDGTVLVTDASGTVWRFD